MFGLDLLLAFFVACFATGPVLWENLPTCDMNAPIHERCREVRHQWGGTVDGRIHDPSATEYK